MILQSKLHSPGHPSGRQYRLITTACLSGIAVVGTPNRRPGEGGVQFSWADLLGAMVMAVKTNITSPGVAENYILRFIGKLVFILAPRSERLEGA